MKYIIRALLVCFVVSILYVSYINRDLLSLLINTSINNFQVQDNQGKEIIENVNKPDDEEIKEVALTKNTLSTIFTYLPFFNINVENVQPIVSSLPVSDAISFELNTNVYEVYEVDNSSAGADVLKQVNTKHTININNKEYLALALDSFVICIKEINDGVALLNNYQEGMTILENFGLKEKSE